MRILFLTLLIISAGGLAVGQSTPSSSSPQPSPEPTVDSQNAIIDYNSITPADIAKLPLKRWLRQRHVPRNLSYPKGSQTLQVEINAGALAGVVTDPNGSHLPDVLVEWMDTNWRNRSFAVLTDSHGRFDLSGLEDGIYYLKLSKPGFSDLNLKVRLMNRSKAKLRLTLPLGI